VTHLPPSAVQVRSAITEACRGLVDREALVELVVLCAVAGEHLLVIGPPGTAKSEAVRRIARRLGGRYFEYLVGRFTASDEQWEIAPTYREAFRVLAKHGVIESVLANELGHAAQLRNSIAHGYATLDVERLWQELPTGIATFIGLTKAIARFLLRP
jgi:MoxR domain in the MoxR-vWA-beta-propeller ternary systems/Protein of unknown function DUF86